MEARKRGETRARIEEPTKEFSARFSLRLRGCISRESARETLSKRARARKTSAGKFFPGTQKIVDRNSAQLYISFLKGGNSAMAKKKKTTKKAAKKSTKKKK